MTNEHHRKESLLAMVSFRKHYQDTKDSMTLKVYKEVRKEYFKSPYPKFKVTYSVMRRVTGDPYRLYDKDEGATND